MMPEHRERPLNVRRDAAPRRCVGRCVERSVQRRVERHVQVRVARGAAQPSRPSTRAPHSLGTYTHRYSRKASDHGTAAQATHDR